MIPVILDEATLRAATGFDRSALNAVEGSFIALAEGRAMTPPVMHLEVTAAPGDVDIKSAVISGLPVLAVKIGAGFFGNAALGLPNSTAMMVAISARTGRCVAVLLDNGWLTDLRTALAGAVAARHLVPGGPLAVAVIGGGAQARYQIEALTIERRVRSVRIYCRRDEQARAFASDMTTRLRLPVEVCADAASAVRPADLIVTTTNATRPVLDAGWLRPGQHVTAVGSDLPGKRELDPALLARADVLVCDSIEQSCRLGELQGASAATVARAIALGDVARGSAAGRRADEAITVCDLSGLGVQDTAIADHVLNSLGIKE